MLGRHTLATLSHCTVRPTATSPPCFLLIHPNAHAGPPHTCALIAHSIQVEELRPRDALRLELCHSILACQAGGCNGGGHGGVCTVQAGGGCFLQFCCCKTASVLMHWVVARPPPNSSSHGSCLPALLLRLSWVWRGVGGAAPTPPQAAAASNWPTHLRWACTRWRPAPSPAPACKVQTRRRSPAGAGLRCPRVLYQSAAVACQCCRRRRNPPLGTLPNSRPLLLGVPTHCSSAGCSPVPEPLGADQAGEVAAGCRTRHSADCHRSAPCCRWRSAC